MFIRISQEIFWRCEVFTLTAAIYKKRSDTMRYSTYKPSVSVVKCNALQILPMISCPCCAILLVNGDKFANII